MADPVIVASRNQVCCDLKGEAVILNLKNGKYYGLDEVGARVWALIQDPRNVSEVVDVLVAEFTVERAACERDLTELVGNLVEAGLVEIRP